MGRPTKYSDEIGEQICEAIVSGGGLHGILDADDDLPSLPTVFRWLADGEHEVFRDMYVRAREQQQEFRADEIVRLSDGPENDTNRARLMVDTRKWLMSKLMPRKYGDSTRIEANVTHHLKRVILESGDGK